jgi:hypothetical protein
VNFLRTGLGLALDAMIKLKIFTGHYLCSSCILEGGRSKTSPQSQAELGAISP